MAIKPPRGVKFNAKSALANGIPRIRAKVKPGRARLRGRDGKFAYAGGASGRPTRVSLGSAATKYITPSSRINKKLRGTPKIRPNKLTSQAEKVKPHIKKATNNVNKTLNGGGTWRQRLATGASGVGSYAKKHPFRFGTDVLFLSTLGAVGLQGARRQKQKWDKERK